MNSLLLIKEIFGMKIDKNISGVLISILVLIVYMKYDFENKLDGFKNDIIFSIDKRLVKIETIMEYEKSIYNTKKDKVKK